MSKECMRKFGVEEIDNYDDFTKVACKDCGAPYGWHNELDCPTKKEIAERSPVECLVMQPAIDRLKNRIAELKIEKEKNTPFWADVIENTIQSLYIAVAVLELSEGA